MDKISFDELELPRPDFNLNVSSGDHPNQIGNIVLQIAPILAQVNPSVLLVQGDTNTVVASALAGEKLGIPVAHLEAGLRSYDRTMPEETNRVLTDHMSQILFAVPHVQRSILMSEGICASKIHTVGNSIVDSVNAFREQSSERTILSDLKIEKDSYVLFTAHLSSNFDSEQSLLEMVKIIESIACNFKVVWPVHPRTSKKIRDFGIKLPDNLIAISPT